MQTTRNYLVIGLVLGIATGIASHKFVMCIVIGALAGLVLNFLQSRPKK